MTLVLVASAWWYSASASAQSLSLYPDAPPEPAAPEVVVRDAEGRATVRAVRISEPLRIDGALDEALYRDVRSISDFIQVEPSAGQAATERTETWVAFDTDYVYVSFKVWDTRMDTLIATEMRRDSTNSWQGNDLVSFIFDTFYDRRTSFTFTMNPLGGRSDGTMINDRQYSSDWNPVWETQTGRFDGGWTVEAAVPFKSLRYRPGTAQVWGFNAMRVKRSKNEVSTLTRVPPARGQSGFQNAQFAASLVGLEAPPSGANLDIKPYAISSLTTDHVVDPRINDPEAEAGIDVKYAVTQGLVADLTVNTDFAQVEADEQQINLTRFNLFFPEKRDFFLENQGTFAFGGVAINSLGGNFGGGFIGSSSAAPIMFYSRRIGLYGDQQVPLNVGGRLTGRAGAYSIGVLNIQTGDKTEELGAPATNFSVFRVKRDVLRRSSIGLLFTNRSESVIGTGANRAYGIDGTFAFYENLQINTYWAATDTDGLSGRATDSYRGQLDYSADRYTLQLERVKIGDNFNPEIGFLRRDDMVRDYARFKFSPRPGRPSMIRKYVYDASIEYIENGAGRLESRERAAEFALEFQSADRLTVNYTNSFEYLPRPLRIGEVVLPAGGTYQFDTVRLGYSIGQQRKIAANLTAEYGTFYSGRKTTLSAARGRVPITNQLSVEPTYSFNDVTLDEGDFTTHLAGSRVTYSMTPLMFVSALIQYNSGINAVSTNARFRWEYRPGSELFVVYNEERNTQTRSFPSLNNRAFIVKINRLFRV
jgi:uncharacterized protein DUF5916/cellulose/xylan binding protein with CBM9 domain